MEPNNKNMLNNEHFEMSENSKQYKDLAARVQHLEELLKIAFQNNSGKTLRKIKDKSGNLAYQVADGVSVVGLKEAITTKHAIFKIIWVILLILGTIGTVYYVYKNTQAYMNRETATKVTLDKQSSYKYPEIVLCPPWWFDSDYFHSLGLSDAGLTYSLSYSQLMTKYNVADGPSKGDDTNLTLGDLPIILNYFKTEFMDFYQKHDLASLTDYYKFISANVSNANQEDDAIIDITDARVHADNAVISVRQCLGCDKSQPARKVIFSNAICYVFPLEDARANSTTSLMLSNYDKTKGLLPRQDKQWFFDFLPNIGTDGPAIALEPFTSLTVKLSTQKIGMLVPSCDPRLDYDQKSLIDECLGKENEAYKLGFGRSILTSTSQPNDTMNLFNVVAELIAPLITPNASTIGLNGDIGTYLQNILNETLKNLTELAAVTEDELKNCYELYKPACVRTIYDVTLDRQVIPHQEQSNDTSSIQIKIRHAAVFQGGIIYWQDIESMTFGEFVANVGGTLGLFLGCTVLTLAQLILSFVNYAMTNSLFGKRDDDSNV